MSSPKSLNNTLFNIAVIPTERNREVEESLFRQTSYQFDELGMTI